MKKSESNPVCFDQFIRDVNNKGKKHLGNVRKRIQRELSAKKEIYYAISYSACKANQGLFQKECDVLIKTSKIMQVLNDRLVDSIIRDEYFKLFMVGKK